MVKIEIDSVRLQHPKTVKVSRRLRRRILTSLYNEDSILKP
jgi:hypothetical protein